MYPALLQHQCKFIVTHPSEVAHSLEVDKVAFTGVQRAIPVTIIRVIVTHSKGTGLWQTAGRQLGCVVVRRPSGLGLPVWHGQRKAFLHPQFPLHFLPSFFLNHYLVCAVQRADVHFNNPGALMKIIFLYLKWSPHLTGAPLPWAGRSRTVIVLSVSLSGDGMSP